MTIEVQQSRSELLTWASDSTALYGLDLSRMSTVLLAQLWALETNRILCPFEVTAAIKALEGLTTADLTAPPELFRHAPLQGFSKKHFTSSRFIVRNLLNFTQSKRGARFLEKAFADAATRSPSGIVDEAFANEVSHHAVISAYEQKARTRMMTGEWIVFREHAGKNFYLTLASHRESNDAIYSRVCRAMATVACPFPGGGAGAVLDDDRRTATIKVEPSITPK